MKKLLLSFPLFFLTFIISAQQSPLGMRYQAVVRDPDGAVIPNEGMTARIELLTMQGDSHVFYKEVHEVNSNKFGILNLTIGEGKVLSGNFSSIPWSDQNIWVRTSIRRHGATDYNIVTTNKLYSVPYAHYANTAGSLEQKYQALTTPFVQWPKIGYSWSLFGNKLATKYRDPPVMGTLDDTPVVFITDNTERMRITNQGSIEIKGDLGIDANLAINDDLNVNGNGIIADSFTVNGPVEFADNLNVNGKSMFADSFTVNGPTVFDINVDGPQTVQSSYPVLIKGSKQGLAIDLVPATEDCLVSHRGNNYISFWRDGSQKGRIEGMGRGDLDPTGLLGLLLNVFRNPDVIANGVEDFGISLTDPLINFGSELYNIINLNTGSFPTLSDGEFPTVEGSFPSLDIGPPPSLDGGEFPSLSGGSFPTLSGGMLPSISFNTPMFTDPIAGSEIENTFKDLYNNISAAQSSGDPACIVETASPAQASWAVLRAALMDSGLYPDDPTNLESQIFSNYTLDILLAGINTLKSAVSFLTSFGSIMDPEDIYSAGIDLLVDIIGLTIYGTYSDINVGVAYESGAGDYAEWLLRANPNEMIQPGDVVGVIGGRISKKFVHADRFMTVSTSPLLLGNMPQSREEERLYEKVAFIGQVPVKVRGEVEIGDYILPSGSGDGVAIAVSPSNMLAKDYQRIIGVAWEENLEKGFMHLVNTAVGVNHNDMAKTIEQMQFTLNHIQDQLKKMDPDYVSHDYEVTIDQFGATSPGYSISDYHPARMAGYFQGHSYDSNAEILAGVRERMVNMMGIDLTEIPLIDHALSNPDQAKLMADEYQYILDDMISVKKDLLTNTIHD